MKTTKVKGSLQAAQAIASSIKTLLGPSQSTKCCVNGEDDRDAIICSNAAKILQYLDVEHPVYYVINDACQAMHKTYGCGCTTLVCMIGFWSRSALMLQYEGVPVPIISKLFDEALDNCFQVLEEIAYPIQETLHERNNPGDIQNKSQKDSISTAASLLRTKIEDVWASTEDDISQVDITQRSDSGLLTTNEPLACTLASLGGDENKRKTQHIVSNLPNQTHDKTIFMADSRESSTFDDTVEDEFDSCFDNLPINVGKSLRKINKQARSICKSVCSSEGMTRKNNVRHMHNITSNKSELERMDQMLKDLSFSGQKLISSKVSIGNRVTKILRSCHNSSINSPKTQTEQESYQPQEDSFHQRSSNLDFKGKEDLGRLGNMLAHGKEKVMALAVEVIFHQMSPSRKKMHINRFDVDGNAINIERLVGPTSEHSQVVSGILLHQEARLVDYPFGALRVALVNGDITKDYRHTGFKNSFQTKAIFNEASYKNVSICNTSWCQRILSVLQTLNIGVVVARGSIDKDLEDFCQALKIQTFSGISSKTFQLLSHSLGSSAVVYLTDLKECHVGRPVFLHHWSGPHPGMNNDKEYFVILELADNQNSEAALQQSGRDTKLRENVKESTELLQTVLLCGPSEQLVLDLELSFWNCVFRLRNTINCGCVLPGAGKTEMSCINKLRQISENPDLLKDNKPSNSSSWLQVSLSSCRPAVYTVFADGLVEFLVNLKSNSGCMVNYGQALTAVQQALDDYDQHLSRLQYPLIADDIAAKKNAWSKAIGVVHVMLQSDIAIVTGSQANTESVQG